MTKEKFIQSTIILMIGGAITKFLGMFIRIIMTRLVGLEGISLYMLVYPTFSLFMTLSQFSMPVAISKLVSEDQKPNKNIMSNATFLILFINLLLIILIVFLSPIIANTFLKDPRCYLPILSIAIVLPFDSISNLLRGYFFGKQRMLPHVISHILEQLIRLSAILIMTPKLMAIDIRYAVSGLVAVNMISEALSIVILLLFLPAKNLKIKKQDIKPNKRNMKDLLEIAVPTTGGRLVGSIGYFLEPILLTFFLLASGYTSSFITTEYGVVSGYVMPLLLLPGFFTGAISNALLPVISKAYVKKQSNYIKGKIKQAIFFSLLIGIPYTMILMLFPRFFLQLFYHTNHGVFYLRLIAPIFLLYYIQPPLASALQSMNGSSHMMWDNILGIFLKTILLILLPFFHLGMYSLLIATGVSVFTTTLCHFLHIRKKLQT